MKLAEQAKKPQGTLGLSRNAKCSAFIKVFCKKFRERPGNLPGFFNSYPHYCLIFGIKKPYHEVIIIRSLIENNMIIRRLPQHGLFLPTHYFSRPLFS